MKKYLFALLCFCLAAASSFGQDKYTISGYLSDAETGEKLIGANVFDLKSGKGTSSNTYGFYSLTLPQDSVVFAVSYIGFETKYFKFYLAEDVEMDFALGGATELEAIEVVAEDVVKLEDETQMSVIEVPISQIKKIPALLGETDVLKALQLLPGVQSGGEGQSGLYVRGGSPDQNLILLDGVPVYNASHLFGFFSVFNADAISNVTLMKGAFPARYGGRLSSVIDINMKEGNMKEVKAVGSIGLISSKLTVEAPLWKDKTSFIVSGRRTYADLVARPFIKAANSDDPDFDATPVAYFYDLNVKVNHIFSKRDRLYLSVYNGKDKFGVKEKDVYTDGNGDRNESEFEARIDWGNTTSALRWNHLWNDKLFSNLTATYSRYKFNLLAAESDRVIDGNDTEIESFQAQYFSGIYDWTGKLDFDYYPDPNHSVKFGINGIYHTFDPGAINVAVTEDIPLIDTTFGSGRTNAFEYAAYAEDDFSIGTSLKANIGLHYSGFVVENELFHSVQPRVGLRYLAPRDIAIKGSFAMMTQYIHLLTNEGLGLPTDLWVPATPKVEPEQSWQAALGVAKTLGKDYEFSIEGYYKNMTNLVSYKPGASFIGFSDWQDKVASGTGKSYGAEFFVQKKTGKFTGWVGYTLSWSTRQFENTAINGGEEYPFKYDRRHDISIVTIYELMNKESKKGKQKTITASASWVYGTGIAVTLPEASYFALDPRRNNFDTFFAETPESKNSFRQGNYHRLDVGFEFTKQHKRWKRIFTLGAYNAYNRKNPFFMYLDNNANGPVIKQVSLFPVVPYFTFGFEI